MSVKKVMTVKSGKFVFSDNITISQIQLLLSQFRILYRTIKDLPILPALATKLEEELIRRSIFSTAAIEGNPLKEEAVGKILSEPDKHKLRESQEIEISNLKDAYNYIKSLTPPDSSFCIDEIFIKTIHKLITQNISYEYNTPGHYRNHIVKVGDKEHGGVYTPPKCLKDIQTLMKEYIDWINSKDIIALDSPTRASLAHYYFGLIHPFGNGNGRTARIIEGMMFRLSGIKYIPTMLSNYYYRNMDEYFLIFSRARKSKGYDITPFVEFVLRGCIESLNEIKQRITYAIRKLTLRDYYAFLRDRKNITKRQYEFLLTLLDEHEQYAFSLTDLFEKSPLKILYSSVSGRTARRDLVKLKDMELLTWDKNKYLLNWRALDAL